MKRLHEFERKQIILISKKYQLSVFSIGIMFKRIKDFSKIKEVLNLVLCEIAIYKTNPNHLRN